MFALARQFSQLIGADSDLEIPGDCEYSTNRKGDYNGYDGGFVVNVRVFVHDILMCVVLAATIRMCLPFAASRCRKLMILLGSTIFSTSPAMMLATTTAPSRVRQGEAAYLLYCLLASNERLCVFCQPFSQAPEALGHFLLQLLCGVRWFEKCVHACMHTH